MPLIKPSQDGEYYFHFKAILGMERLTKLVISVVTLATMVSGIAEKVLDIIDPNYDVK